MKKGFTLVELAIVLVIVGLLVGGVLVGRNLIEQSKINSVIRDFRDFETASNIFYTKYSALAGDYTEATRAWPTSTAVNGNGDGIIDTIGILFSKEGAGFWQQLGLAGVIKGEYMGRSAEGGDNPGSVLGQDVPRSKLRSDAGYAVNFISGTTLHNNDARITVKGGNNIRIGVAPGGLSGDYDNGAATNEQAYGVDVKLDDGKPLSGKVFSYANPPYIDMDNNSYNLSNKQDFININYTFK